MKFQGKRVILDRIVRIGVCNWCRAVRPFDTKQTQLHHDDNKYDISDPLKYTIELCAKCHLREQWLLGPVVR